MTRDTCIICGASAGGPICETHEEDVVFEFSGDSADELTEGRFYRGSVDGYADFGVFVNVGNVTGLLHRSELDQRLESLDWDVGDEVFVQVTNVRGNGDIDLGWSIRQSEREFRGVLVDEVDADRLPEDEAGNATTAGREDAPEASTPAEPDDGSDKEDTGAEAGTETDVPDDADDGTDLPSEGPADDEAEPADDGPEPAVVEADDAGADRDAPDEPQASEDAGEVERVPVDDLPERVGEDVRIEGEVVAARQTSGPTVFELRDETGSVDCAAFEEAGVRAYPEVEVGDAVRIDGEVRMRREELQVETEALAVLDGEDAAAVEERLTAAFEERASPDAVETLADDPAVEGALDGIEEAATAIRRAVLDSRPVVVRHAASTDGYVAGAAIERAVLPLVREEHAQSDATYHYFDRRPVEDGVYDMEDATGDVTDMLDDAERHGEKFPLFVFAAAGSSEDSLDGLEFLDVYDAERVVVDGVPEGARVGAEAGVDEAVADSVDVAVAPDEPTTASSLAATLSAAVNGDVRDDVTHLPAVSFWDETPEVYADLAADAGYDADALADLREAVALEAYYQSYEDKRELITDLLFEGETGLAEQVATQFRTKRDAELETAEANVERREVGDRAFSVIDTDSYTHRFDFPPTDLLLDELHRRGDATVTVGVAEDELHLRAAGDLDLDALAASVEDRVENGGIDVRGGASPCIEFLSGEREAVLKATLTEVAERLSTEATV